MSIHFKILGGTPVHGERSLCFSCNYGHVMQGQAVSDLTIRCGAYRSFFIARPVVECSEYLARRAPDKKEMERVAWILETRRGKPIGFVSALEHKYRVNSGETDEPEED